MEPYAADKSQLPCVAWEFGTDPIARLASELTRLGVTWVQAGLPGDSVAHAAEVAQRYGEQVIAKAP